MDLKIENLKQIAAKGIKCPKYDVLKCHEETLNEPIWLHFGAGNIFRGFIARLQNDLLNNGYATKGIIALETFDEEIISDIYDKYDSLTLLASLSPTSTDYSVIASIAKGMYVDLANTNTYDSLKNIFSKESLQMISFTITEKGYNLYKMDGTFLDVVESDFKNGPTTPKNTMAVVASLLWLRFNNGAYPLAVVSMDNCSQNGQKLQNAVLTICNKWYENGFVSKEFIDYLNDETKITFPWTMIDKITPRPALSISEDLAKLGFTNIAPITTAKHTFIAPFVNAEVSEYLVIEDKFPNGRPALEKAHVYFTDRKTVNMAETMKVTTCLNPLHTALAVYGCMLNYETIAMEMTNKGLSNLVKGIAKEGMKVVVDPKIISPVDFVNDVINVRLPNKAIPDTPARIATDTSLKIPVRYGETIKAIAKKGDLDTLEYIPIAIAGWCRYLLGLDDDLKPFNCSSDPELLHLQDILKNVRETLTYHNELDSILGNAQLFGISLIDTPLYSKIVSHFKGMLNKNGVSNLINKL